MTSSPSSRAVEPQQEQAVGPGPTTRRRAVPQGLERRTGPTLGGSGPPWPRAAGGAALRPRAASGEEVRELRPYLFEEDRLCARSGNPVQTRTASFFDQDPQVEESRRRRSRQTRTRGSASDSRLDGTRLRRPRARSRRLPISVETNIHIKDEITVAWQRFEAICSPIIGLIRSAPSGALGLPRQLGRKGFAPRLRSETNRIRPAGRRS